MDRVRGRDRPVFPPAASEVVTYLKGDDPPSMAGGLLLGFSLEKQSTSVIFLGKSTVEVLTPMCQ